MSGRCPAPGNRTPFEVLAELREEAKQNKPEALEQLGNLYRGSRRSADALLTPNTRHLAGLQLQTKADSVRAARYLSQACDLYQHRISALQHLSEGNSPLAFLSQAFDADCKSRNGLRQLRAFTAWYEHQQEQHKAVTLFIQNASKQCQKLVFVQWSKLVSTSPEDSCKIKSTLLVQKIFLLWSALARGCITHKQTDLQAAKMKHHLATRTVVFLGWKTLTEDALSRQPMSSEDLTLNESDSVQAAHDHRHAKKLGLALTMTIRENLAAVFRHLKKFSTTTVLQLGAEPVQDLLLQVSALEESNHLFKERAWLEVMHWQRKVDELRRSKFKADLEADGKKKL